MKTTDPQFKTLLKEATPIVGGHETENNSISNRIKTFLKGWPRTYNFLKIAIGPTHSPGSRYKLKNRLGGLFGDQAQDKLVLNLGSGTNRIHPEVVNVDLFPFKNVDVVADIANTPFKDQTVDGIVCDSVLEHINNTSNVLAEMARILKPGGTLIITALFLYPYHSSPDDFFRWTESGIKHILKENNFNFKEVGIRGGPMGALQGILMHVFATIFSFGSKTAYFILIQFFMILFAPLKLLDLFFMRFTYSIEMSSDIFIIATKNG